LGLAATLAIQICTKLEHMLNESKFGGKVFKRIEIYTKFEPILSE